MVVKWSGLTFPYFDGSWVPVTSSKFSLVEIKPPEPLALPKPKAPPPPPDPKAVEISLMMKRWPGLKERGWIKNKYLNEDLKISATAKDYMRAWGKWRAVRFIESSESPTMDALFPKEGTAHRKERLVKRISEINGLLSAPVPQKLSHNQQIWFELEQYEREGEVTILSTVLATLND